MVSAQYGRAPVVRIEGDPEQTFPYISAPVEYILGELLKNALRATIEHSQAHPNAPLPPVTVSIVDNDVDFVFKYVLSIKFSLFSFNTFSIFFNVLFV